MKDKAKKLVANYIRAGAEGMGSFELDVIWWWKARDNSYRAIIVTNLDDKMLYEVSYNSANRITRINAFAQIDTTSVLNG